MNQIFIYEKEFLSTVTSNCTFSFKKNMLKEGFSAIFHEPLPETIIGAHNRPDFADNKNHIHYNLTHTTLRTGKNSPLPEEQRKPYSYIAYGFSQTRIGIDAEYPRHMTDSLINKIFTPKEKEFANSKEYPNSIYLTLWTLKEAYSKYTGDGITMDFSSIEFQYDENTGFYSLTQPGNEVIFFYHFEKNSGLQLSICVPAKSHISFLPAKSRLARESCSPDSGLLHMKA